MPPSLRLSTLAAVVGPMRLPFLLLTPACLLPGLGAAMQVRAADGSFAAESALILLGALAAHVSVNAFNEWFDFRSGLDSMTRRTPFSGGSGALPARPELAPVALAIAVLSLLCCMSIGLGFVARRGAALLTVGIVGVLLVVAYTRLVTRSPWLCLVAPGLGFGPLMAIGTELALTGQATVTGAAASLPAFFLASGLLLLNQFPDIGPDRAVGRRHLPIVLGPAASARVFAALLAFAFGSIAGATAAGWLPIGCLLGLLPVPVACRVARAVLRHAQEIDRLPPAMAWNTALTLATPALLGLGFVLGPY